MNMRKNMILAAALLMGSSFLAVGQQVNKLESTGPAGVGTLLPEGKLQVIDTEQDPNGTTFVVGHINAANLRLGYNSDYSWLQGHGGRPLYINYLGNDVIFNLQGGKIGIGTPSPMAKLDIKGGLDKSVYGIIVPTINVFSSNAAAIGVGGAIALGGQTGNANPEYAYAIITGGKESDAYNNYAGYFAVNTVSPGGINNEVSSANYERFRITSDGNVGIGTTTPREKLSVNGKIRATGIKVETANWPDYVFDDKYENRSLTELAAYIKEHKHLPEIPSAKEVEMNGVELGEMNKQLLKKVEELTLHVISQNEKIMKQELEQAELKRLILELSKEIKKDRKP